MRVLKYAALIIGTALVLLPLVWMVMASITPEAAIVRYPPSLLPGGFTTDHYTQIWGRIPFGRQFLNTVIFAGGVTAISLLLDSLAAYALARLEFPGRNAVFVLILLLLMIPPQVTLVPLFQLLSDLGWINTYQGLIVPRATNAFGIFFLRQYFLTIPRELDEAARIDGCSDLGIYRRVILPLSGPALLTLGLFHFMYNWNDLLWPLVFTTDTDMQTLPAGLALFMGEHVIEYGLLMAGAVLTLLPMVAAFLLVQRRFIEGIATTGMK
ncbi:carbohydrate ABC transporter permease [Nonomuraea sp. NPDC050556]|uniref:carbohydrate ABC transporter permease n=1 Tax=Nonomuraea sp. NPDC050556 TaxID=3364369 RepID=UPI0037B6EF21